MFGATFPTLLTVTPFDELVKLALPTTARAGGVLYVNDLPGVSSEMASALTDSDADTLTKLFDKVRRRAWERLMVEAQDALSDRATFKPLVAPATTPRKRNPQTVIAPVDAWRGQRLLVPASAHTVLRVKAIWLCVFLSDPSVAGPPVTVKVMDLEEGRERASYNLGPVTHGLKRYDLPSGATAEFDASRWLNLAFVTDRAALSTMVVDPVRACSSSVPVSGIELRKNRPATDDEALYQAEPGGYGLWVEAEAETSLSSILTEQARRLQSAFWYLTGAELLTEKLASHRLNVWTTTNLEFTRQTRDDLVNTYRSVARKALKSLPLDSLGWEEPDGVMGYEAQSNV
jgi:hypothetical protein